MRVLIWEKVVARLVHSMLHLMSTLQTLCLALGFCVSFFWFMCLVWRKVHAPALALVTKLIQVYHRFCMVSLFSFSLVLMSHGIHLMFVEFWFRRCWEQFECFVGWAETWSTGNHWATLAMKSPANVYSRY